MSQRLSRRGGRLTCYSVQQLPRSAGITAGWEAEDLPDPQRVALQPVHVADDVDGQMMTVGDDAQGVSCAHLILLPVDQVLRLHQRQVGCQHFSLFHWHQQLLRTIQGNSAGEGRIQLVELVLVQVGEFGDPRQIHALLERDDFEVGLVGDRIEIDAIGLRGLNQLRQGQQLRHVVAGFLRQWQVPVVGRQA